MTKTPLRSLPDMRVLKWTFALTWLLSFIASLKMTSVFIPPPVTATAVLIIRLTIVLNLVLLTTWEETQNPLWLSRLRVWWSLGRNIIGSVITSIATSPLST